LACRWAQNGSWERPTTVSTNKIKGSDVQNSARERWGIAWGRVNDVPLWLDPFQPGVTFRSKDYIIHQLKPGESYFDFFNLPIPAPKVMIHVPGVELTPSTIAVDDSTPAQVAPTEPQVTFADIEILQTDPESMVGRTVIKSWIVGNTDHGVCKGTVVAYRVENNHVGGRPWAIDWDDGSKSSFNADDMIKYCLNNVDGTVVTQVIDISDSDSDESDDGNSEYDTMRTLFESQGLTVYNTENNDTWKTICNKIDIPHGQRKQYYQWLSQQYGYGHKAASQATFKFNDPYGSSKGAKNGTMKWPAGVPFPYPGGGAWDSVLLGNDSSNHISRVCRMLEAETKTLMLAEKLQKQESANDQDGNMDYQFPVGDDENGRSLMDFDTEDAMSAMDNKGKSRVNALVVQGEGVGGCAQAPKAPAPPGEARGFD
jgi:hypothetical protein